MSVRIPEPFLSAIREGRPRDVADAPAECPEALYGRGLARLEAGRERAARADFEAALPDLGDLCEVEIAFLDIRHRVALEEAIPRLEAVIGRAPPRSALRARALHVLGLAEGRLRHTEEATAKLLEASEIYQSLGEKMRWAQVQDTLGTLFASSGQLEQALGAYMVSLVEKTVAGDRYGMALTLGNVGRVHLRAGRFQAALECFEMDHRMASEIGDRRGCAKMLDDKARVHMALENYAAAEKELQSCLQLSQEGEYKDMEVFAHKDLALLYLATDRYDECVRELDLAEAALAGGTEPYLQSLLLAVRGQLRLAQRHPDALPLLEEAARQFGATELPDHEIPIWITLARAYQHCKLKRMAEVCLEFALERARRNGCERYFREIREVMAEVGCTDGLIEETGRFYGPESKESPPNGYVLLDILGEGRFGQVFRAYDPVRDQIVALKRFYLSHLYDVEKREELYASARLELEAASRVRHPGVARVFAIGYDQAGNLYVVEEYVKGRSFRDLIQSGPPADPLPVLKKVQLIASALAALHKAEVVHRDLKPENIVLRAPDETPVIVDCGIAYVAGFDQGFGATGMQGTLPFMAPELLRGAAVSCKADMYSLGVVLYEWIAGRLPWRSQTWRSWDEAVDKKLHLAPVSLTTVRPDFLQDFTKLVTALMDPDPERRPRAVDVARACSDLLEEPSIRGTSRASTRRRDLTTEVLYRWDENDV